MMVYVNKLSSQARFFYSKFTKAVKNVQWKGDKRCVSLLTGKNTPKVEGHLNVVWDIHQDWTGQQL